jgi:hypothetical protein
VATEEELRRKARTFAGSTNNDYDGARVRHGGEARNDVRADVTPFDAVPPADVPPPDFSKYNPEASSAENLKAMGLEQIPNAPVDAPAPRAIPNYDPSRPPEAVLLAKAKGSAPPADEKIAFAALPPDIQAEADKRGYGKPIDAPEGSFVRRTPGGVEVDSQPKNAAEADLIAAERNKPTPLDPALAARAGARLAGGATAPGGSAVIISKGGMRPERSTAQVTKGPEVPGAMDALDDAYHEAVHGAAGAATAQRAQDETLGRLQGVSSAAGEKFATEEKRESQNASDKLGAVAAQIQTAINDTAKPVETPQQAMQKWGADKKVGFLLASIVGGIGGENGRNTFLDSFNGFLKSETDRQAVELKQKQDQNNDSKSVYWMMHKGFGDDAAARAGTRALYYQALESRVKQAAIKYNIDATNPRYQAILSQIDTARAHELETLAKISGATTSRQESEVYAPPQAIQVGGVSKAQDAKAREIIGTGFEKLKVGDTQNQLDAMRSAIMGGDRAKGGLLQRYLVSYPNTPFASILAQFGTTPQGKQYLSDVGDYIIKSGHTDFGAAFTPSEQERQSLFRSPEMIPELYNRGARKLQRDLQDVISQVPGGAGYRVFGEMRSEQRDMMNAPGSLVTATGSDNTLPQALPYPPEQ